MWSNRAGQRRANLVRGSRLGGLAARLAGALLAALALCLAALPLGGGARPALAASAQVAGMPHAAPAGSRPPGGNFADPVVRAVDIAEPAVVRIGTVESATLSLQLCTRTVTLPLNGAPYQLGLLGTGAFVSQHGDILTADHVVDVPDFEVAVFAAQDIADVLSNQTSFDPGCPGNVPVSASDVASGAVNFNFTAHVSNSRTLVWLSTGYSGPLAVTAIRDVSSQDATKTVASSYNDDDLALIHVNLEDTPSVRLDDSTAVAVQDQLTVIGFPGNGDVNSNATNFLTPSVNQVIVNAIKTGDNGSALIQVGGNVEHGDSGAPVLDSDGHIVGVVSFGGIADPLGDTTFLRTSDTALSLIQGQSLDLTPGPFEQQWTRAFDDYAASYGGHWTVAAREMGVLASHYPQFQALIPYLTYAQSAASAERAAAGSASHSSSTALTTLLVVLAVLLALGVGLGVGIWLLVRALRKPKPIPAPAFAASGMLAQPPMPYPGAWPALPPQPWMGYLAPHGASALPPGQARQYLPGAGSMGGMMPGTPGGYAPPAYGALLAPGVAPVYATPAPPGSITGNSGISAARPSSAPAGGGPLPAPRARSADVVSSSGQPEARMIVCPHGHAVSRDDMICPWCGVPVPHPTSGGPDTAAAPAQE